MELAGTCALLTGAGGGIGRALAVELAGQGVRLVLAGRTLAHLNDTKAALHAGQAVAVAADLCDDAGRRSMVHAAERHFGRLDLLVHCAGLAVPASTVDADAARFEEQLQVNLLGPIALTRQALPALLARPRSAVVQVLSGAGLVPYPFLAAYSAAKAGLAAFGDALHRECCGQGLHVLNVYPGPTDTPMLRRSPLRGAMTDLESPADLAGAVVAALRGGRRELIRASGARSRLLEAARQGPERADAVFVELAARLRAELLSRP